LTDVALTFVCPACPQFVGALSTPRNHTAVGKRWRAIRRHVRQIEQHCEAGDLTCRRRQRQALVQWAYDSRKI
jgi:hypothetical protein